MSSPSYAEFSIPAPHAQAQLLSTPAAVGTLLTSKGHKKYFPTPKGSLPVQSSLSPSQSNGEHSSHFTEDLGENTHTEGTLGHLLFVGEDEISSQSALGSIYHHIQMNICAFLHHKKLHPLITVIWDIAYR